jgi:hypothetical protein
MGRKRTLDPNSSSFLVPILDCPCPPKTQCHQTLIPPHFLPQNSSELSISPFHSSFLPLGGKRVELTPNPLSHCPYLPPPVPQYNPPNLARGVVPSVAALKYKGKNKWQTEEEMTPKGTLASSPEGKNGTTNSGKMARLNGGENLGGKKEDWL